MAQGYLGADDEWRYILGGALAAVLVIAIVLGLMWWLA